MKKILVAMTTPFILALAALGGMFTRQREIAEGFDAAGLAVPYAGRWALIVIGVLAVVLAVLKAVLQTPRPGYAENFGRGGGVPAVIAGALVAVGCAMQIPAYQGRTLYLALYVFGVAAGLCLAVIGVAWMQKKQPFGALHVLPTLFVLLLLISRFRGWSQDPVIADYCYSLFAAICSMIALLHLAGFCFGAGKRRMAVCWNLLAVYFCPLAMPGAAAADVVLLGGLFLFHLQASVQLLWPDRESAA